MLKIVLRFIWYGRRLGANPIWCKMFDTPERKLYSTLSRVAPYGKWESIHGWRYIPCIGDSEIHWLLSPKMCEFLDKKFGLDTLEYYYQGDTGESLKESKDIVNYFKSPEKLVFKDYIKESSDYHIIHKSRNIYRLEFDTNVGYENPSLFIRLKDG